MYLLDTDYIIARLFKDQSTHSKANTKASLISNHRQIILDLVLFELATVVSHKFSHKVSVEVIQDIKQSSIIITSLEKVEIDRAWSIFTQQKRNKTSFVDCANLAASIERECKIISFDKFYPKSNLG